MTNMRARSSTGGGPTGSRRQRFDPGRSRPIRPSADICPNSPIPETHDPSRSPRARWSPKPMPENAIGALVQAQHTGHFTSRDKSNAIGTPMGRPGRRAEIRHSQLVLDQVGTSVTDRPALSGIREISRLVAAAPTIDVCNSQAVLETRHFHAFRTNVRKSRVGHGPVPAEQGEFQTPISDIMSTKVRRVHLMNQERFERPPPAVLGRVAQSASTPTGLMDCARFSPPPSGAVVATRADQRSFHDGPTSADVVMIQ